MNLLDEEEVKQEEPKNKKMVLRLLILSVALLIIVMILIAALKGKAQKGLTLSVNNQNIVIDDGLLISDNDGKAYISIEKISKQLEYNYIEGDYIESDDTKDSTFYLENSYQVVQFEIDSNKIYKYDLETKLDKEEYELKNKIIKENNLAYIDLEDLNIGLNVVYSYSQDDNNISINTVEFLTKSYNDAFEKDTEGSIDSISDTYNNEKAISHDMLVVQDRSSKWGVINKNDFSTIIQNKYMSIEYIEYASAFIVCENGKYGIIIIDGNKKSIIDPKYEEISIVCNSPLCYKVKYSNKYGIIDKDGNPIINNDYELIGFESKNTIQLSVVTIEGLGKNKSDIGIVVCKQGKYGIMNLNDGNTILECNFDKIYAKNENNKKQYYIEFQGQEISLNLYLDYINSALSNSGTNTET